MVAIGRMMEFSIPIEPDKEGYTGRECPECEKYFKIKYGTGLPDAVVCHCPYCNHIGPQDEFWTKQQIEYAQSIAINKVTGDLLKRLKKLETKPKRNEFISIGISKKGNPSPIAYYSEQELEEKVKCENCTLEYTIYGIFAYCPDCGIHNSKQMISANYELVIRMLELSAQAEKNVADKLIENSLEDAISAFDGFGRELCSDLHNKISFQNIEKAKIKLLTKPGIDISFGLDSQDWNFVIEQFQKRHLLAHKMGVIDEKFVKKTGKDSSLLGRKVSITLEGVQRLIKHLKVISENIYKGVNRI